ncbi:MAG: hypothetical protein M3347_02310, partial [Armatimonadota bacterium]|nr:hypothetical protein [Armatimonadota bacterium]
MKRILTPLFLLFCCAAAPMITHATVAQAAAAYQYLEDEAEPQVDVSFTAQTAALGGLTLLFDFKDNKNFYALELMPTSALLRSMIDGTPRRLASAPMTWKPTSQITLKRRPWVMQVIVERRVVLTAYDATFNKGKIGFAANGGWSWKETRVQSIVQPIEEELYFTDDFTRLEGQQTEWKEAGGKWTLTASSENISTTNMEMSANPFSYQAATPTGDAFAHVGRRFWDNYDARISARPTGRGTMGLAVYVQDPKNYLAFLWSAVEGPKARQLVRVVDGSTTVLASAPGAFLPRQWYRVGVRTSPGYLEASLDGSPVFKVRNDWFGQGGVGLIARDMSAVNFDDLRVQSFDYYRLDFAETSTSAWTPVGGVWKAENGVLTSTSAPDEQGGTRVYLTGRDNWTGYEMTVSARTGAAGGCGLMVGYRDNKNYAVFRWAGPQSTLPFKGRQQLLHYRDGKATIVRDDPVTVLATADTDGYVRIDLRMNAGQLAVYADNKMLAQTADERLALGRPGLWAQGTTPVSFRDVVMFFPPPPEKPKVPPKMASDSLMVGWASPSGEWPPSQGENGLEFWNTGDFFGDTTIEFPWRKAIHARGKLELALRAQRDRFDSGYVLRVEGAEAKGDLRLTLLKGTAVLKQVDFNPQDLLEAAEKEAGATPPAAEGESRPQGVPIRIELEGRGIAVSMGGRPVLAYLRDEKEEAPTGTSLSARATGFALRTKDLRAFSANRDDYTFNEAPTDWYSPSGNWSVISRWPCYSDWSFFGGQGLNPVLWTKRTYSGDTVVEMYAHNQMDLPKELGYSKPGDLNLTIGGDGKNPSSGYSFVVAGWDNTRTRILKGSQVVAENATEAARFIKPINHNMAFHRRWYYIRAEVRQA